MPPLMRHVIPAAVSTALLPAFTALCFLVPAIGEALPWLAPHRLGTTSAYLAVTISPLLACVLCDTARRHRALHVLAVGVALGASGITTHMLAASVYPPQYRPEVIKLVAASALGGAAFATFCRRLRVSPGVASALFASAFALAPVLSYYALEMGAGISLAGNLSPPQMLFRGDKYLALWAAFIPLGLGVVLVKDYKVNARRVRLGHMRQPVKAGA